MDEVQNHKRFFLLCAVVTIGLLVLVGTANYVVDPYGSRDIGRFPALQENSRQTKLRLLEAYPEVDTLILGSSRVMQIHPEDVGQLTDDIAFNAGVNSGNLVDAEALYRYLVEAKGRKIRRVILGLDLESFSPNVTVDQRLREVDALLPFADEGLLKGYRDPSSRWFQDLTFDKSKRSLQVLRYEMKDNWPKPSTHFEPDGHVVYDQFDGEIEAGSFNFEKHLEKTTGEYRGRFRGFNGISEHAERILRRFLARLVEDGVETYVFITPLHSIVSDALRADAGYAERLEESLALIADLQSAHAFHFLNAESVASFDGEESNFYDGAHFKRENAKRLMKALFER